MAFGEIAEKLYPPNINGSLPAFYGEKNGTTIYATIVVPFSMNRAVSMDQFSQLALKIKTVQSNTLITTLYSKSHTEKEAIFEWNINNNETGRKINIGQFLKAQLAYVQEDENKNKIIGYYSTVGIIKYTSKPKVYIEDLGNPEDGRMSIFKSEYTGIYETSEDKTERPYSYKFSLYDNNLQLVETSDWRLHNTTINNIASESMSLDKSTDLYNFDITIKQDTEYYLQYTVKTINNLEVSSPLYLCVEPETEDSDLIVNLRAENIFEEGYIQLSLNLKNIQENQTYLEFKEFSLYIKNKYNFSTIQKITNYYQIYNGDIFHDGDPCIIVQYENSDEENEYYIVQSYHVNNLNLNDRYYIINFEENSPMSLEICRAEKTDDFSSWKILQKVYFSNYQELLEWTLNDFTVEQGIIYKYCFRQYNANVKSNRVESNEVMADFEDMFLYDGKKQVKIRFNPKISSFKINRLEQKTDTIGNRYPFIFRNGIVEYKEFPISGLISYHMDNNELFVNHLEDLHIILGKQSKRLSSPVEQDQNDIDDNKSWEISETLDTIGYNMRAERRFKLKLLEWLGNGEIKLFRSPTEGNYLVRLMNISLSPEDKLGRMLHSFSCTAYEMKEYTYNNLRELGFIDLNKNYKAELNIKTSHFQDYWYNQNNEKLLETGILSQIQQRSDLICINKGFTIYNQIKIYVPSGGRFGNSVTGFYLRLGKENKILVSPARGFIIEDYGNQLPDIYFSLLDNLNLINQDTSNMDINEIKSLLKDLIGDAQIDYQYSTSIEKIGEFKNLEDVYLKTEIKSLNEPGIIYFQTDNNGEKHEALKIYNLNFIKKPIKILWKSTNNVYYDCTDIENPQQIAKKDFDISVIYEVHSGDNDLYLNADYPKANKITSNNLEGFAYITIGNNSSNKILTFIKENSLNITDIDKIKYGIKFTKKDNTFVTIDEPPIQGLKIIENYSKINIPEEEDIDCNNLKTIQIDEGVCFDYAYLDKVTKRSV